jgi:hypothetical protein
MTAARPAAVVGPGRERKGREVSLDWFEASVKRSDPDGAEVSVGLVFVLLVKHFGDVCGRQMAEVLRDDARAFDARGPLALRVRADQVGQQDRHGNRRPWVGARLPGEFCRAFGTDRVLAFVDDLDQAGELKVSRVDVALDDFDKTITPRMFAEACVAGDLDDENALLGLRAVTRVKPGNWEWSRRLGGCFWLGGRRSARLLRVYDKDTESKGQIPSTRIELQQRDEFATALVQRLLEARSAGQGIAEMFLGHLVEFVDLREPSGPRSSSHKWPRLPWWRALVGDAKGISMPGRGDSEVWAWSKRSAGSSVGRWSSCCVPRASTRRATRSRRSTTTPRAAWCQRCARSSVPSCAT